MPDQTAKVGDTIQIGDERLKVVSVKGKRVRFRPVDSETEIRIVRETGMDRRATRPQ